MEIADIINPVEVRMSEPLVNLLVVEDFHEYAELVESFLRCSEDMVFAFYHADALKKGLEILENETIDIVLLDLNLPDSCGLETFRTLQKRFPDIPIVINSGEGDYAMVRCAIREGAQDYLIKYKNESGTIESALRTALERSGYRERLRETMLRIEMEMDMARTMQMAMLPSNLIQCDWFETAAIYRPSNQIGGDLYDFHPQGKDGLLTWIFDVSGHGIPAAFLAGMAKLSFSHQQNSLKKPGDILNAVNAEMLIQLSYYQFLTAWVGFLDRKNRRLYYSAAGHPAGVLLRNGKIKRLGNPTPGIGFLDDWHYRTSSIALHPGDRLILFTDGITEARNFQDEMFSEETLLMRICQTSDLTLSAALESIFDSVQTFSAGYPLRDDITLMGIDFQVR